VGIGGALAEARTEAGLTVTQVSERTRIRATIVRDIERDDYSACGGDYYARGHIRAIARVVGTDPVPLIEEYDAARMPPEPAEPDPGRADSHGWRIPGLHRLADSSPGGNGLARDSRWEHGFNDATHGGNGVARNSVAPNRYGSTGLASGAELGADPDADTGTDLYDPDTLKSGTLESGTLESGTLGSAAADRGTRALESAARWAGSARARLTRPAEPEGGGVPGGITAAEAFRPSMPIEPRRPLRMGAVVLVLIVLAAIGVLIFLLGSGGSSPAPRQHGTAHHSAGTAAAKHRPGGSSPTAAASAPAPVPLTAVSAAAFGPDGGGHGDDPQQASLTLQPSDSTGWHTDWYASASFGGLQSGTGLLLDMGKPVTVTSARILLGAEAGGAVELRAGSSPSLRQLRVVAQASDPGGTLTLPVRSPVRARYLLVWFTSLPRDSSGTYQASIYSISLAGTA
jgi:transcriptional regulator with XRE-family HTH domain